MAWRGDAPSAASRSPWDTLFLGHPHNSTGEARESYLASGEHTPGLAPRELPSRRDGHGRVQFV